MLYSRSAPQIVIIDDDDEDVFAIRRAFEKAGTTVELVHFEDGRSALDALRALEDRRQLPRLILLDIHMPNMDGFDVLLELRRSGPNRQVPVLMFSTSDSDQEVERAYSSGANAHLVKPSSMSDLQIVARAIHDFWLIAANPLNRP